MMFALLLRTEWYKFLHSPVDDLPENEECLYLTTIYNEVQFIPNINYKFFSQSSKCQLNNGN